MTQITEAQYDLLVTEICSTLMAGYTSEGEEIGMGDMGDCDDEAKRIVNEWMVKAEIILE